MEGCAVSAHTISTTPSYEHYYKCTTAATGYFILTGTDRPHRCRSVANAQTVACSDHVATQVTACKTGYIITGSYSAGSTSNACSTCTDIANAAHVKCTSRAGRGLTTTNRG